MGENDGESMLAEKVRQGYPPGWGELAPNGEADEPTIGRVQNYQEILIKLISGDKLLAMVKKNDGGGGHEKVKFERVFS